MIICRLFWSHIYFFINGQFIVLIQNELRMIFPSDDCVLIMKLQVKDYTVHNSKKKEKFFENIDIIS